MAISFDPPPPEPVPPPSGLGMLPSELGAIFYPLGLSEAQYRAVVEFERRWRDQHLRRLQLAREQAERQRVEDAEVIWSDAHEALVPVWPQQLRRRRKRKESPMIPIGEAEQPFWRAILDQCPRDLSPLGVLADWFEERGEQPDLAYALRWAWVRGHFPMVSLKKLLVRWGIEPRRRHGPRLPWELPRLVFWRLRPYPSASLGLRSRGLPEAFDRLAQALKLLRQVVALTPPEKGDHAAHDRG